jgi:hypothetical protein
MGISRDEKRGRYRLALYNAYNACGLIGTEYNGIVVLDDKDRCVVVDNLAVGEPQSDQTSIMSYLLKCSAKDFAKLVNDAPRARFTITPDEVTA